MRARNLRLLQKRIRKYLRTGNKRFVLNRRAEVKAAALLNSVVGVTEDIEAVHTLGCWYWFRFLAQLPNKADGDLARAVKLLGPVYQVRPDWLPRDFKQWYTQHFLTDDTSPLELTVRRLRQSFASAEHSDPERLQLAIRLGATLMHRAKALPFTRETIADCDETIRLMRQIMEDLAPSGQAGPGRATARIGALLNLGLALQVRATALEEPAGPIEAVAVFREAAELSPEGSPDRVNAVFNLAFALSLQAEAAWGLAEVDEAEALLESVQEGHSDARVSRSHIALLHSQVLALRYFRTRDPETLDKRIAVLRQESRRSASADAGLPDSLVELAAALQVRFSLCSDLGALQEARTILRAAIDSAPPHSPELLGRRGMLVQALLSEHVATGAVQPLEDALAQLRVVTDGLPPDLNSRAPYLVVLGHALTLRHHHDADAEALTEAVAVLREVAEHPGLPEETRGPLASTLAAALETSAARSRDQETLTEALALHREALSLAPRDSGERLRLVGNLANALRVQHEIGGASGPLEESVDLLRGVVESLHARHPLRPLILGNFGICLLTLAQSNGDPSTATEATSVLHEAVEAYPPHHPRRTQLLAVLVDSLDTWQEDGNAPISSEQARDLLGTAVAKVPQSFTEQSSLWEQLHRLRSRRIGHGGDAHASAQVHTALESLWSRIEGWLERSDTEAILDPAAAAEVELLTDVHGGARMARTPIEVVWALGWFHLARHLIAQAEDDLLRTVECFTVMERINPALVPAPLRPLVARQETDVATAAEGPDIQALVDALRLTARYGQVTGDAEALRRAESLGQSLLGHLPVQDSAARQHVLQSLAYTVGTCVEQLGYLSRLDEAIALYEQALESEPGQLRPPQLLSVLGGLLSRRFELYGRTQDIEEALDHHREALADQQETSGFRTELLCNLVFTLHARNDRIAPTVHDLDEAVDISRSAVDSSWEGSPARGTALSRLSLSLKHRYRFAGDPEDLAAAVDIQRAAVAATPEHSPKRALEMANLGSALMENPGPDPDGPLVEGLALHRQAVGLVPDRHPLHPALLTSLGRALLSHHQHMGDRESLLEGVGHLQRAVRLCEQAPADSPPPLDSLAFALLLRHLHTGSLSDAHDAVFAARTALEMAPDNTGDKPELLQLLGSTLLSRYQHTGDTADLSEAHAPLRDAVASAVLGTPSHAQYSHRLAVWHFKHFQRFGTPQDLDRAIELLRSATAAPHGPSDPAEIKMQLIGTLNQRYTITGDPADLEEAVSLVREVAVKLPAPGPGSWRLLGSCGDLMVTLSEDADDADLLAEGLRHCRAALAATPADHAERPERLAQLSAGLRQHYRRTGSLDTLNEAILLGQQAVRDCPPGHIRHAYIRTNLALMVRERFERLGDAADLDDAIGHDRAALARTSDDDPDRPRILSNLAASLARRASVAAAPESLDEAIELARAAVQVTSPRHIHRFVRENCLIMALVRRHEERGEDADIEEAVRRARACIAAPFVRDAVTPDLRSGLGVALLTGFRHSGDPALLRDAIGEFQAVARSLPDSDPRRALALVNVGTALTERYQLLGTRTDLDHALTAWQAATKMTAAPISVRLTAATAWGDTAAEAERTAEALDGYTSAVALLPLLAWRGLDRSTQERHLETQLGMACEAAGSAVQAGLPARALELLEQGRSVLWSQLLETRDRWESLRQAHPELATRLDEIRAELDGTGATSSVDNNVLGSAPYSGGLPALVWSQRDPDSERRDSATRRQNAAAAWDRTWAEVRRKNGFSNFLGPPRAEDLAKAALGGAVVVVNVGRRRCDALVVRGSGVEAVPLPRLTFDDTYAHANEYLHALEQLAHPRRLHPREQTAAHRAVAETLHWLWDTVAEPVLIAQGHTATPEPGTPWPRIWWCPTGPLNSLPLHAATPREPGAHAVLDLVVSSYTPTLRALRNAREPDVGDSSGRMLIVGVPRTPYMRRGAPLPAAAHEVETVAGFFPGRCTPLLGPKATRDNVLTELPRHRDIHLSCHGRQTMSDPSQGSLYFYDAPISIAELSQHSHPHARLAFLSACQTATGGVRLPDEALTIASTMQLIGYRHIVATLWSINDSTAPEVARAVYAEAIHKGRLDPAAIAVALHNAVRAIRADNPEPSRWAPYLHVGP
ncbi:CHAT domain-containing protein [Streptomyces sp. NBC_01443]|uniref:CHAT domain-containing protein n=1 Tax=Streptomyces sp. NBC_01443 TaxID=2903868 RepID=UPI002252E6CF|nr:CHAT domain-containing protein [Streptomyces sp. NBC_01443]MCX4632927.1 CHAT domain-containing protein [Streptomyces sp. NBC_01443]